MSGQAPTREAIDGLSPCERVALSIEIHLDGDSLPTEFRLLKAGANPTADGRVLYFGPEQAAATMAAYEAHQVDRMIDLEHLSLDQRAPNYDPDARAWCRLELRDGELWSVDVRWTPDGTERLHNRTQRYISPTVDVDAEGRVLALFNIALTALPALHATPALVAASAAVPPPPAALAALSTQVGSAMDPSIVSAALDALEAGDATAALALLKDMLAAALGAPAAPEPLPDEMAAETTAAASMLMRLAGKTSIGEAARDAEQWHTSHVELTAERAKLAAERATLELGQRRANAATLVKLGAETPHTSGLATGTLAKRLVDEPIVEQTARVAALLAARGGKLTETPQPPTSASATHGLDERELAICAERKCDPATFAALKARMRPPAS